jgi:hypothetical protein
VSWDLSSYAGPADGHKEHLGYWKNRTKAVQSAGYARRRKRQRLGRRKRRAGRRL